MAYSGSTAASTLVNTPHRIDHGGLAARSLGESTSNAEGRGLWFYNSTNLTTDMVSTGGFFTDGTRLGMRNGDCLISVQTTGTETAPRIMIAGIFGITTGGAARISTASMITSTFA